MSRPNTLCLLAGLWLALAAGCAPKTGQAFADLQYPEPASDVRAVKVGSVEVAYAELGEGERTVLLIHGLGSYLPVWSNNLAALARDHRVVAIDLPGYGKSSKHEDYAYSMEFFAHTVQGVIEELSLGHPVIVGHSMGGQIAMTHALLYPGRARGLVLTSPAGLETFEDGEAKWLADAVTDDFTCKTPPDVVHARMAGNFHRMPKKARFMVSDRVAVIGGPDFPQYCQAVSRSVRAMLDEPVYDRLVAIDTPTLVLFGKNDALIPNPFLHGGSTTRLAERTVTQLPQAELVMLPKAGHMAQFEQADAWNDAVLRFLSALPDPPEPKPTPSPSEPDQGEEIEADDSASEDSSSDAEESDAEESDAEDADAEESEDSSSDAEDADAEESDAEDADAEDADTEDSDAEDAKP